MGRWGPTGLGPKEAALLDAAAVGDGGMVCLPCVALRVAVRLGPGDPLLLPPPGVVVRGVADVVVDKRVGLLVVRVDLVLTVAPLAGQRTGVSMAQWGQVCMFSAGRHRGLGSERPLGLLQAPDRGPLSPCISQRARCPQACLLLPSEKIIAQSLWIFDVNQKT